MFLEADCDLTLLQAEANKLNLLIMIAKMLLRKVAPYNFVLSRKKALEMVKCHVSFTEGEL